MDLNPMLTQRVGAIHKVCSQKNCGGSDKSILNYDSGRTCRRRVRPHGSIDFSDTQFFFEQPEGLDLLDCCAGLPLQRIQIRIVHFALKMFTLASTDGNIFARSQTAVKTELTSRYLRHG